jgi:hypothetical protein
VLRELQGQLDRVKTEGVTAAELGRAKRQFARDYILGRDTVQQKALHLAHAVVIHNDIKTADAEFDLFQNVTVADVQRVARTYFTPESRMLLTILPRTGASSGGCRPVRSSARATPMTLACAWLLPLLSRRAHDLRRRCPAVAGEPHAHGLGRAAGGLSTMQIKTLANGLQVSGAAPRTALGQLPAAD